MPRALRTIRDTKMPTNATLIKAVLAGIAALGLAACSASEFIGEPAAGDTTVDETAPVTTINNAFLFDTDRNLTANLFVYDAVNDTITINNLPFDNTDESGNSYANAGTIGGTGIPFYQSPQIAGGTFNYFAVILESDAGYSFGGSVATGNFGDFGFGGAYIERSESALPPEQVDNYIFTGDYAGTRVVGNGGAGNDDVGFVVGTARLQVDLRDLDTGGSAIGGVTGRTLYSSAGVELGTLAGLQLNLADINQAENGLENGTTDVRNADGSLAQQGEWLGSFAGPNGEEIVGFLVVEGTWSDNDFNFSDDVDVIPQEIRETGVFILER